MMNGSDMMGGSNMMGGLGTTAYGGDPLGGILSLLLQVAVIIGIVLFVLWLVRQIQSGGSLDLNRKAVIAGGGTALDILKERYARGEIEKAEYEEKKKVLT